LNQPDRFTHAVAGNDQRVAIEVQVDVAEVTFRLLDDNSDGVSPTGS
jgi:hypothetical protein